jgi:dGTP triphosphohydrolase
MARGAATSKRDSPRIARAVLAARSKRDTRECADLLLDGIRVEDGLNRAASASNQRECCGECSKTASAPLWRGQRVKPAFFRAGLIPLHRLAKEDDDAVKRLRELLEDAKQADVKAWAKYSIDEFVATVAALTSFATPSGAYHHARPHRRRMRRFDSDLITRYLEAFRAQDDPTDGRVRVHVDNNIVREVGTLKMLVRVYVIRRPGLAVVQHGQQRIIRDLFEAYYDASEEGKDGDRRELVI